MSWLDDAIDKVKKALGFNKAGNSVQKCAPGDGSLIVIVENEDAANPIGDPIQGADVEIQGKTQGKKKTDKDGVASFKSLQPDTYRIKVTFAVPQSNDYEEPDVAQQTVIEGDCQVHVFLVRPLAILKVKVIYKWKDSHSVAHETALDEVKIRIEGKQAKEKVTLKDVSGWARFGQVKAGEYKISVTSMGKHAQKFSLPTSVTVAIAPGERERDVVLETKSRAKLRIVLLGNDDKPISGKGWELLSPLHSSGKTAANGLLEADNLNLENYAGALIADMITPPVKKPAPAPAPAPVNPPAYPPSVISGDFKDKDPATIADPDGGKVRWTLKISPMVNYDNLGGIKSRLRNLGFACGSTSDDATTKRAVKAYQKHYLKQPNGSGALADIKNDIFKRHDNP